MDIRSLLDRQGRLQAERPFLTWAPFAGPARRWCFAEFVHAVRRFAAGLHRRGVAPGDRILIRLENCPEGLIAWLGSAYAGVVPVTTNARSTATDLAYFAAHSRAVGAVTQPRFAAMVRAAAPSLGWIVQTDHDAGEPAATARPADERFEDLAADPSILPPRAPDPWAPFGIQYTSGTTARPKAVLWTHGNALWGARSSAWHEGLRAGDVQLVHLPLFHTNAQVYSVLAALWAGASIVLMPRFSASRFWPISVEHGATFTSLVPFCVRSLLDQPVPEDHAYRLWANAVCAPLSDARFGIRTMGWWGMTETIAHGIVGTHDGEDTPMSMGRPAPGYAVYILDQHGAPVRAGETGDLFVGGVPGVSLFLGYADDPAATARAFRPDGLFITGDRVRVDEDGSLFFADRSKDMLKVGGENVAASEIESVIARVAGVAEVAVVAMPHAMLDEAPAAFVLPAADIPDDLPARIEMACAAHLASFKRPHLVRIVDALPRATLGKIAKAQLRETLLADMEAKS